MTIDIPDALYETLRRQADREHTSVSVIAVQVLQAGVGQGRRAKRVTGPLVTGTGEPGPLCPDTENPSDLLFS